MGHGERVLEEDRDRIVLHEPSCLQGLHLLYIRRDEDVRRGALLYLGVKNIKLGPVLPAFLSPAVTKVVVEKFNISLINDVQSDMEQMLR